MILFVTPDQRGGAKYALMPAKPRVAHYSKEYDRRAWIAQVTMPETWSGSLNDAISVFLNDHKGGEVIAAYYEAHA